MTASRLDRLLPVGVGMALLVLYLATMGPTIDVGDAGELVAAAITGGIPHPPGYPLWCVLMVPLAHLPGASPAVALTVASAVLMAAAAGLVTAIARRALGAPPPLAAGAGLLLGILPAVWGQAIVVEVYALGLATFTALVLAFLSTGAGVDETSAASRPSRAAVAPETSSGPSARAHLLVPFLVGICLAANPASALAVSPIAVGWILRTVRGAPSSPLAGSALRGVRGLAAGLGMGILGLLPVLYLPLRARTRPFLDWGHPADLSSLVAHLTRDQYAAPVWPDTATVMTLADRWRAAASPEHGLLFLAALLGIGVGWRRAPVRWLAFLWIVTGPVSVLSSAALLRGEQRYEAEVFFLPAAAITVLLAIEGIRWTVSRALDDAPARVVPAVRAAGWVPLAIAVVAAPILVPAMSRRGNHIAEDYGRHLLEPLPANAILFVNGDTESFAALYLQARGVRPDVTLRFVEGPPRRDARGHPAPHRGQVVAAATDPHATVPVFVTLPKPPFDSGLAVVDGLAYRYGVEAVEPTWRPVTLRHRDGARLTRFEELALARVAFQEAAYHFARDDREAGIAAAARARGHGLRNPRFLVDLGTLLVHADVTESAASMWRRAVTDDPRQVLGWQHLIRLALLNDDRDGAIALYREARSHNPDDRDLGTVGRMLGVEPGSGPGVRGTSGVD